MTLIDLIEIATETNRKFGVALEKISEDPGTYKKKLWQISRTFKQRPNGITYLINDDRCLITDAEKATEFSNQFASTFEGNQNRRNLLNALGIIKFGRHNRELSQFI